ncbi:MAG: cytochrome c3 family protein [Verrucomicrobia bacterium]|nr:cytochrome c3 family protein [Verrucomicrobiota bacterium]MDA7653423.1 cytochrome c family protein [bacterium]MBT7734085.1 cytochrome c3 family protein [Verrucomicrobiota bacterium]MDB4668561.1 cytochrome c family protein [bacterium]MDB4807938.1 cytochrome c family protein [Verrucomicrobiota bacterium]
MSDVFPRWTNRLPGQIIFGLLLIGGVVTAGLNYYFTPKYTRVGYQPTQPVPFSHSIHVKQLGLDCRYCHDGVEKSWYSNVPAADTCMNCHSAVRADDPKLEPVRASYKDANKPVEWVQIHKLPDYVYFNHSVHVNRGVSCVECHGRVDEMDEVRHEKHFSMTFCLDCHRDPNKRLRPLDKITDLAYERSKDPTNKDRNFVKEWHVKTSENCSACHR